MSIKFLPEEIIERILIGLPGFDLVRCKAVCKAWRSLISSADFVDAHLQRSKSDPSSQHILVRNPFFDTCRREPVASFSSKEMDQFPDLCLQAATFPFDNKLQRRRFALPRPVAGPFSSLICLSSKDLLIVGSVNGLICIADSLSPDDIWIFNPVTGLSKELPFDDYDDRGAYNQSVRNIKLAFWCDDGGVYNVAKILTDVNGKSMLLLWVSTSPDTWSVISTFESDFHLHPRPLHVCDVIVEGLAAYWIVVDFNDDSDDDNDIDSDDGITLISLNFKSLVLTRLFPLYNEQLLMRKSYLRAALDGNPNPFLFGGNLNGEFVLVAYSFSDKGIDYDRYYDVWSPVMNDNGTPMLIDTGNPAWIKKFRICLDSFPFDRCLGIVNDKLVLTRYNTVVALFDPLKGVLEKLETDSKVKNIPKDCAHGFVGSLVSIDGFGFEWNDLLRKNMCIRWPYSLYRSTLKEGWRKNCKKRSRWQ